MENSIFVILTYFDLICILVDEVAVCLAFAANTT